LTVTGTPAAIADPIAAFGVSNMAKSTDNKMPVNVRSVRRRIEDRLPEHQRLKKQHGDNAFFVVDIEAGTVIESGNLEALGRKLGALEPWERIIE
jgi:hypothetical protein